MAQYPEALVGKYPRVHAWTNGQRRQALSRNMPSRQMANAIMKQAGIDYRF